ncbi:molybdate ABC transporter substrate-binding protein [Wenyingzhuangia fucanilytica]|nr:molybdate ABC transporter substrate-binding protein [Wenyingzhuangia fucanilytica]
MLFIACNSKKSSDKKDEIVIATAANMQFSMKEITTAFEKETNIKCSLVISSSGKLTAQIKEGAPYDVFVSANMKYPEEIYNSGFAHTSPKIYAFGKLALWSLNKQIKPNLTLLKDDRIKHIALANPDTAPYGFASVEVMKKLDIYNEVKNKLVYGESISQTNQFITLQSVEIGFTAMSVVLSSAMKEKGNWIEIDKSLYTPIKQGVVVIKNKNIINPSAIKFYDFLFTDKAQIILKNYGYDVHQ